MQLQLIHTPRILRITKLKTNGLFYYIKKKKNLALSTKKYIQRVFSVSIRFIIDKWTAWRVWMNGLIIVLVKIFGHLDAISAIVDG